MAFKVNCKVPDKTEISVCPLKHTVYPIKKRNVLREATLL